MSVELRRLRTCTSSPPENIDDLMNDELIEEKEKNEVKISRYMNIKILTLKKINSLYNLRTNNG